MEDEVPQALKTAAIIQIVSGLINWLLISWMACGLISTVCGILTFWAMGLGGFCGYAAFLLVPIGWAEIGVGIYGLTNPKDAAGAMKIMSYVEMGSILFGGLISAICGGIVFSMLGSDEVTAYVEG